MRPPVRDYVLTVDPQPLWTLAPVRDGRPFATVAETGADAEYPSTFLMLERGSSTASLPERLARISQCAMERRLLLTGAKPVQQLSLRLVAARADHGGNDMV